MATYQIVCKKLSSDGNHIEKVGLARPGKEHSEFAKTPKQVNDMIDQGDKCFFTDESGASAEVDQLGDDFIRTKPDGKIHNNLRSLRDCKFS